MTNELVWAAVGRKNDPNGLVIRTFRDYRSKLIDHLKEDEKLLEVDGPIDTSVWRFGEDGILIPFTPTPQEYLETNISLARRERDMRLNRTDWIEFPSNIARKSPYFIEQMTIYRQNARDAVTRIKTGLEPNWLESEPEELNIEE